jgi:hypothetical protein
MSSGIMQPPVAATDEACANNDTSESVFNPCDVKWASDPDGLDHAMFHEAKARFRSCLTSRDRAEYLKSRGLVECGGPSEYWEHYYEYEEELFEDWENLSHSEQQELGLVEKLPAPDKVDLPSQFDAMVAAARSASRDGTPTVVYIPADNALPLETVQMDIANKTQDGERARGLIECSYLQMVPCTNNGAQPFAKEKWTIWLDEEGRLNDKPANERAFRFLFDQVCDTTSVCGNVILSPNVTTAESLTVGGGGGGGGGGSLLKRSEDKVGAPPDGPCLLKRSEDTVDAPSNGPCLLKHQKLKHSSKH